MNYPIKEVSEHSSIYRGFLLIRRPATALYKIARYEVTLSEQSFGLFDAQAQATEYIDSLFKKEKKDNQQKNNINITHCQRFYNNGAHAGNIHYKIDVWGINSPYVEAEIKQLLDQFILHLQVGWQESRN